MDTKYHKKSPYNSSQSIDMRFVDVESPGESHQPARRRSSSFENPNIQPSIPEKDHRQRRRSFSFDEIYELPPQQSGGKKGQASFLRYFKDKEHADKTHEIKTAGRRMKARESHEPARRRSSSFENPNIQPSIPEREKDHRQRRRSSSFDEIYELPQEHSRDKKGQASFLLSRYFKDKEHADKIHELKTAGRRMKAFELSNTDDSETFPTKGYLSTKEYIAMRKQQEHGDLLMSHIRELETTNLVSNMQKPSLGSSYRPHVGFGPRRQGQPHLATVVKTRSYGSLWYNKIKQRKISSLPPLRDDDTKIELQLNTGCSDLFAKTLETMGYEIKSERRTKRRQDEWNLHMSE